METFARKRKRDILHCTTQQPATIGKRRNSIKTNKEYSAVYTQLNTTKADNSKIETQSLELLKNIEADEAECKEIPNQINEQKQHLEQLRTEVETLAGKYQAQIDKIQTEWDQVAQTIPEKPLEIFKRVTESYDGQAVAVIEVKWRAWSPRM